MCNNEYMGTVRVLGTSCDIDVCGACGKPELKKTVVIEVDGEIGYYGCDCAARIIGWGVKDIRAKAKDADDAERDRIKVAIQSHPLTLLNREELEAAQNEGLGFRERMDSGLLTQWTNRSLAVLREVFAGDAQKAKRHGYTLGVA